MSEPTAVYTSNNGTSKVKSFLTRAHILATDDIPYEDVRMPEWDTTDMEAWVRIRSLTARERDHFEQEVTEGGSVNIENIRARLVARAVVDERGQRIFTDDEAAILGEKSNTAINRLFDRIRELSGMTASAQTEIAKNS